MPSNRARLDVLVSECRATFINAAIQLKATKSWNFCCPCVVLDGRSTDVKAVVVGVGSIGNLVPISAAIDSPEIKEWLRIASEKSPEVAFAEMLNGDEDRANHFNEAYARLIEERQTGIKGLWSADDLCSFVSKSRAAYPKALSAIALMPGQKGQSHCIFTFESDISTLLGE